jgi:hypothetical protein
MTVQVTRTHASTHAKRAWLVLHTLFARVTPYPYRAAWHKQVAANIRTAIQLVKAMRSS